MTPTLLNDGLIVFAEACEAKQANIIPLIEETCLWVAPETVQALPVWYPETHRKAPMYDAKWKRVYTNTSKVSGHTAEKQEPNIKAAKSFWRAIGFTSGTKPKNWTVCHIWSIDDSAFQKPNTIIQDAKYYSCIANMVALPTPLKALTDSLPNVKTMLRVCAYNLYGWVCESPDVRQEADSIKKRNLIPKGYPESWPRRSGDAPPKGMIPYDEKIAEFVRKRKGEIARDLHDASLTHYPRAKVHEVLKFWKIRL